MLIYPTLSRSSRIEKKYIVYKRFIEGEKDPAIAKTLGVSSQAVSKQRRKIMKN